MKSAEELRQFLRSVDRKGYPAYKGAKGAYRFRDFILNISHVQGDPFASPSKLSIRVEGKRAGFPHDTYEQKHKRVALQDFLLRKFAASVERYQFKARGSGKSGLIAVSRCGQEILDRTACQVQPEDGSLLFRLEVGFPANARTISSGELIKILFEFLPECVDGACFYEAYPEGEKEKVRAAARLAEDQEEARRLLPLMGLTAFVANGAVLPRESGISDRPMRQAVPFTSPVSMEVTLKLPNAGEVKGMGLPKGVTLIVGGGYHGKSTLLSALETGVYNHTAGDGRELVISDSSAVKLRAEDGRSVKNVDISPFINNLPDHRDTKRFCTGDASGSTSQAAAAVEAMESGAMVFLVDEDTSATNFMVRDELMQRVVHRDKEPITPFVERVRALYDQKGISTILVAGSSGSYFHVADYVIQMDCYVPREVTKEAKEAAAGYGETVQSLNFPQVSFERIPKSLETGGRDGRFKMKALGRDGLQLDREVVELRFVEQLADTEQLAALGYLLKYAGAHLADGKRSLIQIVDALEKKVEEDGLASLSEAGYLPVNLCLPRRQEIFACLNRCRSLLF